uniref:Pro-corazonin n=1 Tax=Timema douglasi TaxID=61478 RepID=A0A7R8VAX3_TIMDO|nr:unnamed protein product [Timema douglasi]
MQSHGLLEEVNDRSTPRLSVYSTGPIMTCPRSSRVPVLLILLSCLTGIILAQTFQYSRGWTNGRKRGFVVPRAPVIVAEETLPSSEGERDPCQLQRMKYVLEGRNVPQSKCTGISVEGEWKTILGKPLSVHPTGIGTSISLSSVAWSYHESDALDYGALEDGFGKFVIILLCDKVRGSKLVPTRPIARPLYAPCNVWRGFKETASDELNDRYKRDTTANVRHSLNNNDAKMADKM